MNEPIVQEANPFESPAMATEVSASELKKMEKVARQFNAMRQQPPTVLGILFVKRRLILLTLLTIICMWIVWQTATSPGARFAHLFPIAAVGFFVGAVFRDVSHAYRLAHWWPSNIYFINWDRVDELDPTSNKQPEA